VAVISMCVWVLLKIVKSAYNEIITELNLFTVSDIFTCNKVLPDETKLCSLDLKLSRYTMQPPRGGVGDIAPAHS
jgi:hypothetical protein